MPSSRLWRAARAYAERNIYVFPLAPGTKLPLIKGGSGHLDATTDASAIDGWWRKTPMANVGIACAASGFVVVDVDTYKGGDDALGEFERVNGGRPRTWECLARGIHIYFVAGSGSSFRAHLTTPSCGVEVKHHGYVVAPPSIHPTGIVYTWDVGGHPTEIPVADLPPAWARALAARGPGIARAATGPARRSLLGAAFAAAEWLGADLVSGAACARCPWVGAHTDGRGDGADSSTVILPPTTDLRLGRYHCSHAHCRGRDLSEVMAALPRKAIAVAGHEYPREMGVAIRWIARAAAGARKQ